MIDKGAGPADGPPHRITAANAAPRLPAQGGGGGVMMFIPGNYVPLTDAVVEAFAFQHSNSISAAGLKSDEAKQIAAHWLARERLKVMEDHAEEGERFARRTGKRLPGVVPRQLTPKDRALAQETVELQALTEKGMTLKPLLKKTWNDLRSRLSAGEMVGYLMEPNSGK